MLSIKNSKNSGKPLRLHNPFRIETPDWKLNTEMYASKISPFPYKLKAQSWMSECYGILSENAKFKFFVQYLDY